MAVMKDFFGSIGKIVALLLIGGVVFCSPCQAESLNAGLNRLANQIARDALNQGKQNIAVLDLNDLHGRVTEIGKYIAEELRVRLIQNGKIGVVERKQLKEILDELNLQSTGSIDENSARRLGKLVGADAICTGVVTELQKSFKVNAKLLDSESGRAFAAASVAVDKSDELQILRGGDFEHPGAAKASQWPPKQVPQGNLILNGGFQQRYDGWQRQIGDITKGSSQTEIISFSHANSGKALHIRHKGEGFIQFAQTIPVPGPDLTFFASYQAATSEGLIIGFSGSGVAQIGLQYFDDKGSKLGETILVNYVKNPFADTPLIGVPRRSGDTYKTHYIEFTRNRYYRDYKINIREEIENNLLGIDPGAVRSMAVILWCGATHPQAGAELWVTDIGLMIDQK